MLPQLLPPSQGRPLPAGELVLDLKKDSFFIIKAVDVWWYAELPMVFLIFLPLVLMGLVVMVLVLLLSDKKN